MMNGYPVIIGKDTTQTSLMTAVYSIDKMTSLKRHIDQKWGNSSFTNHVLEWQSTAFYY